MTAALITGARGFLARHLLLALRRRGAGRITGVDLRGARADGFDDWREADLTDAGAVHALVKEAAPTSVFHLVGAIRGDESALRASNVTTAAHLLGAVREAAPGASVVLVGSAAEYGRVPAVDQPVAESFDGVPANAYGRCKRELSALAVRAAHEWGARVMIARPFNVIGAGISDSLVVGAIIARVRAAIAGPAPRAITIGTTSSVRDFVAAGDVAEGLAAMAEGGRAGEAYNFCSGEGHAIADVLGRLLAMAPDAIDVRADESLVRAGEVAALVGSWEKAHVELDWRPSTSLDASLRAAWDASAPAAAVR